MILCLASQILELTRATPSGKNRAGIEPDSCPMRETARGFEGIENVIKMAERVAYSIKIWNYPVMLSAICAKTASDIGDFYDLACCNCFYPSA